MLVLTDTSLFTAVSLRVNTGKHVMLRIYTESINSFKLLYKGSSVINAQEIMPL